MIRTPVASVTDQKLEEVNVKRIRRVLFAVPVTALVAASVALAEGRPLSARSATVRVAKTNLGKILVSDSGATLFVFTRDGHNRDKCVTVRGCSAVWPPLKVRGKPVAGAGVKSSRLAAIKLSSGAKQVSYDGHPLYTYSFSSGPGDTSYVGTPQFGGHWYALNAAGHVVK